MVLVCYNVFGLFVRHPSWSVEGETKVSKHPVGVMVIFVRAKTHYNDPSGTEIVSKSLDTIFS